jgi:hypothetical protein
MESERSSKDVCEGLSRIHFGSGELLMNPTAQSLKDEFLGRVCIKADDVPALLNQPLDLSIMERMICDGSFSYISNRISFVHM